MSKAGMPARRRAVLAGAPAL